jgi:hypothetical protein
MNYGRMILLFAILLVAMNFFHPVSALADEDSICSSRSCINHDGKEYEDPASSVLLSARNAGISPNSEPLNELDGQDLMEEVQRNAESSVSVIELPSTVLSPQETTELPLYVTTSNNIAGFLLNITYDPEFMFVSDVTSSQFIIATNIQEGWVKISGIRSGDGLTGRVNIATMEVQPQGDPGDESLLTAHEIELANADLELIPFIVLNGIITIGGSADYFEIPLKEGWNLISLPFTEAQIEIPDDIVPVAFAYNPESGQYDLCDMREMGAEKAYWVASRSDCVLVVRGFRIPEYTTFLNAGWNMIGSSGTVVLLDDLLQDPEASVLEYCFSYDTDGELYSEEVQIVPGRGYWLGARRNCTIWFPG